MPTLEPVTAVEELKVLPYESYLLLCGKGEPFVMQKVLDDSRPSLVINSLCRYYSISRLSFVNGKLILEKMPYEVYHIVEGD
jgi:hypothetical protein